MFKFLHTIVCIMQNTKNIKIISALYEKILAEGDFEETVEKLLAQYSATMVAIQQNEIGDFFLNVAGRNIPYKITGTKKTVRISIVLYDSLRRSRILPEESFSSVLFRLFAVQQREQGQSGILIKIGDCRQILKTIPSNSVHCCVTSPPYYGLRSYCDSDSPEKYLEIGIEPTPQDYIYNLVEVFREVRRVLREDSSLWLVLGDCYSSYKDAKGVTQTLSKGTSRERAHIIPKGEARNRDGKMLKANGYKNKYLMGLPWAVANALREDGWWLRSDNI